MKKDKGTSNVNPPAPAPIQGDQPSTASVGQVKVKDGKLTIEEFTLRAIEKLASTGKGTIHTVYSGFNDGFREYFPGQNPVVEVKKLVDEGKISFRLCKGGAIIGKPGAISPKADSSNALKKMGLS